MEKSLLPESWSVPDTFRRRLGDRVGRQRSMVADGHLLLVLHAPPAADDTERRGRLFWRRPDGGWESSVGEAEPGTRGEGRAALVRHLDEFARVTDELDQREREASTPDAYFEIVQSLAPLHRTATNLLAALQSAREACPEVRELINLRDRANEIARTAELTYSEARYGLEFVMAKGAQSQAVAAHRLNILAAVFFPVVTLAAIFGVNLRHGFEELEPPTPFLVFIAAGLTLGLLLKIWVSRSTSS